MNNITLRQIRTFLAVAESGSFRRASERVHLSQPAVTAHVQQLEEELGMPLLDRTTRRVRVTAAGERFRARAQRLLAELGDLVAELKDEAALERGRVLVACVPTIASRLLPRALARFRGLFPGITLTVNDVVAAEVYEHLVRGQADIGIGPQPSAGAEFEFEPIARDPYVAVVPRDHPWARRRSVSLRDLARAPFLTMNRESNVRGILESALAAASLKVTPLLEARHHFTLGGMVEAGLGVTALPSMAVSMLSQPLLKTVPITGPRVFRDVGIVKLRGNRLTPAAEAFIRVVLEEVDEWRRERSAAGDGVD